jgi:hypothetical protein
VSRDWNAVYALQDWALDRLASIAHGFYMTGGTALGRGYYGHRYSDDLDFFANDAPDFALWRDRCLEALRLGADDAGRRVEILLREARFGRAVVYGNEPLKLEFVNDVPCRIGTPWLHPALGRLDTRENILANKISALVDRAAPKDLADIYWMCCRDRLDILDAIEGAAGKAAGIFPPLVARALEQALSRGISAVFWIEAPGEEEFRRGIEGLIERIMSAGGNP